MRIAVLNRNFATTGGGAESYSVQLTRELAQRHEVHVFCQSTDQPVAGVTYHHVPHISDKPRWLNQLLFAVCSWWMTRCGFVVHAHENTWHGQVHTVHVRPTRYNLFQGKSGWPLALSWLRTLTSPRLMTYLVLEGSRFKPDKTVVATSETLAQECRVAYPGVNIAVVTPGVRIPQIFLEPHVARKQLGLPQNVPIILFVANDYAKKGLDTLLSSLELLTDVHLAVVGSRNPQVEFVGKVNRLGLQDRVHFLGPLSDVNPAYQSANLLVHPTLEDTFAMVVLEAMANRLPVLVSGPKFCGISAQLVHEKNAILLNDPRNSQELLNRMVDLLKSSEGNHMLKNLSEHGLAFACKHTWQKVSEFYEFSYVNYKNN